MKMFFEVHVAIAIKITTNKIHKKPLGNFGKLQDLTLDWSHAEVQQVVKHFFAPNLQAIRIIPSRFYTFPISLCNLVS